MILSKLKSCYIRYNWSRFENDYREIILSKNIKTRNIKKRGTLNSLTHQKDIEAYESYEIEGFDPEETLIMSELCTYSPRSDKSYNSDSFRNSPYEIHSVLEQENEQIDKSYSLKDEDRSKFVEDDIIYANDNKIENVSRNSIVSQKNLETSTFIIDLDSDSLSSSVSNASSKNNKNSKYDFLDTLN